MRDLFDLISTSMPEGNPNGLRPEEYVNIAAFILRSNDYPAGEEELGSDLFRLGEICIVEAP